MPPVLRSGGEPADRANDIDPPRFITLDGRKALEIRSAIGAQDPGAVALFYGQSRPDNTTQQEAQRPYWQHLINLSIHDTSSRGKWRRTA